MNENLKILMFGWEFPPHNSGGLGVACFGLTKALSDKNVKVTFVLPKKINVHSDSIRILFADLQNVQIKPINSLLTPYITSEKYMHERILYSGLYGWGLFEEVFRYAKIARKIAKEEQFDIIHAHDWLSFPAGIEAKEVSGKPLIVHVHSTEIDRTGGNNPNSQVFAIEKEGMEKADKIIAVSNYTKNIIVNYYGIPEEKVEVIHNGIDSTHLNIGGSNNDLLEFKRLGCKMVLFVGRLTLQKGPDYFLKAAKKVLEFDPNVIFIFAGSGDMEYKLMQEAASLGISDKVSFAGFLRGEDLIRLYKSADLFVLPSVSEPFGIAPLESVVNGTPVLISKQSGVSEVLSHSLKTDFWDIDDITDKILSVLDNTSLRDTLKTNSQEEVKKITWSSAAGKCLDLYKRLIGGFK